MNEGSKKKSAGEGIELLSGEMEFIKLKSFYSDIRQFSEGLAPAGKDGIYGYIDKDGNEIIPFEFEDALPFSQGLAPVKKEGMYGYIDKDGKEVIPFEFEDACSFSEGLAPVKKDGMYGYIDKDGKEVIPFEFEDARSFSGSLAPVKKEEKYGYIDKNRNVIIPFEFRDAHPFSEGLALVKKIFGYNYINKTGRNVISFKIYDAHPFSEGLAPVMINKERIIGCFPVGGYTYKKYEDNYVWIYINKMGEQVIPFEFEDAHPFSGDYAFVKRGGKSILINKMGEEVLISLPHNRMKFLGNNLFFLTDCNGNQYLMKNNLKIEKIPNTELNTNDVEKIKIIASKINNAKQIRLYYDLIIDGKLSTFYTLEERNDALGVGMKAIKKLTSDYEFVSRLHAEACYDYRKLKQKKNSNSHYRRNPF